MREIKFKFLMESGEVTESYYLKELIDSDSYISVESEYSSKIKQELQYTGLKDKNGVEIYEGDIIRAKDYLTKDNKKYFDDVGIVKFKDGMFMICDDFPSSFKGQIIEVIGNIYENPELIKD